jgi:hypothetical protein
MVAYLSDSNLESKKMLTNKKFGIFISFIFASVFFLAHLRQSKFSLIILFFCLFFVSITFFATRLIEPFKLFYFKVTKLFAKITSPIMLSIIYFGLITPLGILLRICNRDVLDLKRKKCKSYWKEKNINLTFDQFKNQF